MSAWVLLAVLCLLAGLLLPAAALAQEDGSSAERPPRRWNDDPRRHTIQMPSGRLTPATTDRTNVVVVMLDDMSADAMPRLLERLPAMRRLFVEHGTRFTRATGDTPLCCPGRATFLTGLYTIHHGVNVNEARLFDPTPSLATRLSRAGYHTIIAGKYLNHTGKLADKTPPGWSKSLIFGGGYFWYHAWRNGRREYHDDDANDYSTDVAANAAVAFLRRAPADQPVFALLTPFATHTGVDSGGQFRRFPVAAPRHRGDARCDGVGRLRPPNYDEADVSDKPDYVRERNRLPNRLQDGWPLRPACEALLSVDAMMARVRAELHLQGRLSRTVFMLVSDNGMTWGAHRQLWKEVPYATPLPLYVRWPAALGEAPAVIDEGVSMIDLAPTICDLSGCSLGPYGSDQPEADGVSLAPLLSAEAPGLERDVLLETHRRWDHSWVGVRTTPDHELGAWHYVEYADGQRELYDLGADPWEMENLAGLDRVADVQSALRTELDVLLGR